MTLQKVITPDGEQKTDGKLLVAIADKYEGLIKQKLSKEFKIVEWPGEGTIRVQVVDHKAGVEKQDKDLGILLADVVPILE